MFGEVFGDTVKAKGDILHAPADGTLSLCEIAEAVGFERGGSLSSGLYELVETGFAAKYETLNPRTWKASHPSDIVEEVREKIFDAIVDAGAMI